MWVLTFKSLHANRRGSIFFAGEGKKYLLTSSKLSNFLGEKYHLNIYIYIKSNSAFYIFIYHYQEKSQNFD